MPRVFLVCAHAVLTSGVEALLRQEPTVQFLGCEADPGRALEQIRALSPDVVIAVSAQPLAEPLRTVLSLMAEGRDARVIGLSLADNAACICLCEHRLLASPEDLLAMIAPCCRAPGRATNPGLSASSPPSTSRPPGR